MTSGNVFGGTLIREHDDTERFRFFRVSSKERVSGTPYNFEVNFGNMPELNNIGEMHLLHASIPNIMNNISTEIGNNIFSFDATVAGPGQTININDGFYATTTLIGELQTEINLLIAPSTISITQNANSNKIEWTITGADTIDFKASGLGRTVGILTDSGVVSNFTSPALPSLNGSTVFYIHSSDISTDKTLINSSSGGINAVNGAFTIPISVPYGTYQDYTGNENLDRIVYGRDGRNIRGFRITLRTNEGRLCTELTDNFEWITVLKVIYN